MKKIIASVVIASTFCLPSIAQDNLGIGVTAGLNVSKMDLEGAKSNNGWFLGVTGRAVMPLIGLGVEGSILYSTEKVSGADFDSKDVYMFSIPVMARYEFPLPILSNYVAPYAFAGPQFDYAFDRKVLNVLTDEGSLDGYDEFVENANKYKLDQTFWRFNVGVGVLIASRFQLSYCYSIPISNSWGSVSDNYDNVSDAISNASDAKIRTQKIALTVYF